MTERLIDAVCPHCGRVGTTVRVVLQEDGHTKLSRRCTDCGGECIHTFDHDWLAAANNKKLRAENERLTSDVALVAERVRQLSEERDYAWAEVEKLRSEIERMRDVLRRVSVHTSGDGVVKITFVKEDCMVTYPVCPQTTWALELLVEFDQARRAALDGKP